MTTYAGVMQGWQSLIAISPDESAWGTAYKGGSGSSYQFLSVVEGGDNLMLDEETTEPGAVGMRSHAYELLTQGIINPHGSFTVEFPYNGLERLLKHAFGNANDNAAPTSLGSSAYKSVFKVSDVLPLSGAWTGVTLHIRRGTDTGGAGTTFSIVGVKINSLELSCQKNGFLRATFDVLAKDVLGPVVNDLTNGWGTGTQYAVPAQTAGFYFGNAQLYYTTSSGGSGTATVVQAEDITIKLDNKLDPDRNPCGFRNRFVPVRNGKLEATAEFTLDFDRTDQWDDFRKAPTAAGAGKYFIATFIGPKIGASNFWYTCKIEGNSDRGRVIGAPIKVENSGRIKVRYRMKFYGDVSESTSELTLTLINGTSTF